MAISTQEMVTARLKKAVAVFTADLQAIPPEHFTKTFGDKTRSVADIVFEVNMVNDHIGRSVRGEDLFEWPDDGWIKAPEGFADKAEVIKAFEEVTAKQVQTAESLTNEQMEATMTTEHGETRVYERFLFMGMHMWYHSGQLNYIQTLLGDDGWHW